MNFREIKSYQFSNHFGIQLHASQGVDVVRWRYPVCLSAKEGGGSNPKVTEEYLA